MANKSKSKGNYGERRWAKLLMEFTGKNFRKTPSSGGFNKQGGVTIAEHKFCGDVICDDPSFIFSVESKNRPEDFQVGLLLHSPETAKFTEWWYQTIEDAKAVDLYPFLGFKINKASNTVVGNDFVATTHGVLMHIEYPYWCPRIALECYDCAMTIKVPAGKKMVEVETKLPNAYVVAWKLVAKNCNKERFFIRPEEVRE
jgi:hypothetical protein